MLTKRISIFYDNVIFYLQRHGGVSRYFSEMIKRMANYDDVNVTALKRFGILPRRLTRLNTMFVDFKLANNSYDLYHPTYYSENIKKRKGIKTVITVYDLTHELFLSRFKELGIGIRIKKESILNADHIICISKATKDDLMKIYSIEEKNVSVVHLGLSLTDNDSANMAFDRPHKPYLLYVGKRTGYKNFNILLKAFSLLDIKRDFDLICFGGGRFLPSELSEFRKLKLEKSIKYIEGPDGLLQLYYKNAYIFVLTSLYEGFGLPVLEAMANGCPVIASTGGSIPEIVGDAALLFSPDNTDDLSSCLKRMLDNHIRFTYVTKGKERVKSFSWDATALNTYKIYKRILNA